MSACQRGAPLLATGGAGCTLWLELVSLHASAAFVARQPGYPSKYMNTQPFPSLCRERIAVEMQACLLDNPEGLPDRGFEAGVLAVWSTPAADKEQRTWHAVAELPLRKAG